MQSRISGKSLFLGGVLAIAGCGGGSTGHSTVETYIDVMTKSVSNVKTLPNVNGTNTQWIRIVDTTPNAAYDPKNVTAGFEIEVNNGRTLTDKQGQPEKAYIQFGAQNGSDTTSFQNLASSVIHSDFSYTADTADEINAAGAALPGAAYQRMVAFLNFEQNAASTSFVRAVKTITLDQSVTGDKWLKIDPVQFPDTGTVTPAIAGKDGTITIEASRLKGQTQWTSTSQLGL